MLQLPEGKPYKRVVIVTTSPLISNPRVVKEASWLAKAGYGVTVLRGPVLPALSRSEAELNAKLSDHVEIRAVDWNTNRFLKLKSGLAQKAFRALHQSTRYFGPRAYTRLFSEFKSALNSLQADIYIAHNLTALPVTFQTARQNGCPVAFDAEDFHSGQFAESEKSTYDYKLTVEIEREYIPKCDYVTAASSGIADAYATMLNVRKPTVILNVFPLEETRVRLTTEQIEQERPAGARTVYWFSQTIGPERGLETAVEALRYLPEDVALVLRGVWANGYEGQLRALALGLGVESRLHYRPSAAPWEMIAYAACHDVGLVIENTQTVNRDICVTNKLFTFLAGSVPCVLTDTQGQRPFAAELTKSTRVVPQNSASEMAQAILELLSDPTSARQEALQVTRQRYNFDVESRELIKLVGSALG